MLSSGRVLGRVAPALRGVRQVWILLCLLTFLGGPAFAAEKQWFKGDLHCHTLWSDGQSFPDQTVDWYKSRGFNFLALSDHNVFQQGERWVTLAPKGAKGRKKGFASQAAYELYKQRIGAQAIDEKTSGAAKMVRLKTYKELSKSFNEDGKFLLIPAEEISTHGPEGTDYRVHVNAVNIAKPLPTPVPEPGQPHAGAWIANEAGRMIKEQSQATGIPMHRQLNHPFWSHLSVEEICSVSTLDRMEINNDASGSSATLVKTEAAWDTVIDYRIKHQMPLMFVTAVDDAHSHLKDRYTPFGSGHGWVQVHAASLTRENIIKALNEGDFYASRGPVISEIRSGKDEMELKIEPEAGLTYKTEFIGMRKGGKPGEIFASSTELNPVYKLTGDEVYLRAKVTSSKARLNDKGQPEYLEMAWTQPYLPGKLQK